METVLSHVWKLRNYPKYALSACPSLLESLYFLKDGGWLGPLWLEWERGLIREWEASGANKGWAWGTEETTLNPFEAWKFNSSLARENNAFRQQLELGENEWYNIFLRQEPPTDAMQEEMNQAIVEIKERAILRCNEALERTSQIKYLACLTFWNNATTGEREAHRFICSCGAAFANDGVCSFNVECGCFYRSINKR